VNPLLFKAHPLLYLSVDLLLRPSAYSVDDFSRLVLIYLIINLPWMAALWFAVRRTVGIRLTLPRAYGLALPSAVVYAPLMLTVSSDILAHAFRLEERYILIFVIAVASQMLGALYGFGVRFDRTGRPIGIRAGLVVSLFLLLASIPFSFLLLGLNAVFRVI
jgi:tetrahydromethanopterin S-methyltransferase subunit G